MVLVVNSPQKLLRFGVFQLNVETDELFKSDIPIKLPPQPLRLLALLAGRAGQVVTRAEIQEQIWGEETYVDFDHGVNKCINQIRTALGDSSENPVYVETLPRHGYRFVAPVVTKTVPAPQSVVIEPDSGQRSRPPVLSASGTAAATAVAEAAVSDVLPLPEETTAATLDAKAAGPASEVASAQELRYRFALAWIGLAVLVVVTAVAVGGALYWRARTHKAPVLTDKDTIVLADLDNKTGDPVFNDTLKQGLDIQLEQSPFLALISPGKVSQTLKLMGRSADTALTPEVAREVCQRTGSKAMLTGAIAALGSQYVIGLRAIDCNTGDVLAEAQDQAPGKEAVLKTLDTTAVNLRSKLGESLSSVEKYATPLEEATTPSLEALQAYSEGETTMASKGDSAALPFFKRAVELDPNFATAYAAMANVYSNLSEMGRAAENARKAYELRGKATERERFAIEADYYMLVTGELEKAAQVLELQQQSYPRDQMACINLSAVYSLLGNWEKAVEQAREGMRLEPTDGLSYENLGAEYTSLNRLDEAEAVYKEAQKRQLESESLLLNQYQLAFLQKDSVRMAQMVSAAMGKPGAEDLLLAAQADTEGWYGRLKNASQSTRRAMESARRNDAKEIAATYQAAAALREVESGYPTQARAEADAALKLAPNRDVQAMAALAVARSGDTASAEKLAAELDRAFPLGTLVQEYWLPTIRAAAALEHRDPSRAIELLQASNLIELGQPTQVTVYLCPVYLRGEAYLMLGDGNAAAAEFQKFIDRYGLVGNFPWGALARLGLGRAYALEAKTDSAARDKALAAYRNFLTLWKDADPDIPVYKQAQAEYAKLGQ